MRFTGRSVFSDNKKIDMMKSTSLILVPFVLCAMGLMSFFVAGCSDEKKAARPVADPPSVYMKDTGFRKTLADQRGKIKELLAKRAPIVEKMQAMVQEARKKLNTTDDKKVEVELKKNPEWEKLHAEVIEMNNMIEALRKATTKIVGERIAPKKPVSK